MKKIIYALILAALVSVCCLGLYAQAETYTGSCGTNVTYALDTETGVLTISGNGAMNSYFMYRSVPWYSYRSEIKSIVFEDGVTSIGCWTGYYCSNLTNVEISDSVEYIEEYAFKGCTSLTSIEIPDSVTSIGSYAFDGCTGLTSIEIGDSVKSIGEYALNGCTSLTSIEIPDSVTSVGSYAFYKCSGLKSAEIGDGITNIPDFLFSHCTSLASVKFGDAVKTIGESAFRGCTSLENVEIGGSVTSIGNNAFYECTALESIEIPVSVKNIGNYAFLLCYNLAEVYYGGSEEDWAKITIGTSNLTITENAVIYYDWNCEESIVPVYATYSLDKETGVLTISGPGVMEDYTNSSSAPWYNNRSYIKSVVIENGVTSIGTLAFDGCSDLTSIEIPDSVTNIGNCAFRFCKNLKSITLPRSITSIGDEAFCDLSGLTSIEIPDSVTSIGAYAFKGCSNLTGITIPDSVTSIGASAFAACYSLKSATIPGSVTSIGASAFALCDELESVKIGDGIKSIGGSAFNYCEKLTSIEIPDSVTSIGNYVFSDCTGLTRVKLGNALTSIGDYAFYACQNLTSIEIPDSVTSMGDYVFQGCTSLESVTLSEGMTKISDYTFYDCTSLNSVGIPESITSIGSFAFNNCNVLTIVCYGSSEDDWAEVTGGYNEPFKKATIYYNWDGEELFLPYTFDAETGSLTVSVYSGMEKYLSTEDVPWYKLRYDIKSIVIEKGVTSIGDYAFYDCQNLTTVEIPDSVISIGKNAFANCTYLTEIKWNAKNVADFSMDQSVFYRAGQNGEGIHVTFGDSVEKIPSHFAYVYEESLTNAPKITSVTIGNSVTSIGGYAFAYCNNLVSVEIPDSVTNIGSCAFFKCTNLESIKIPDGVTSIYISTFDGCSGLTSVEIGSSVAVIDQQAFEGCSSLINLTIPDSVTSIGYDAFKDCSSLTSVTIGNGVTSIESYAFYGCTGLTSVTIPDSVTETGRAIFRGCTSLTSVTIGKNVRGIEEYVFYDCNSLESIIIPESVTSIGYLAFYKCDSLEKALYLGDKENLAIDSGNDSLTNVLYYTKGSCGTNCSWALDYETGVLTISGSGEMANYSSSGDVPWHKSRSYIKSIVIENGITSVGDRVFYGCIHLTSVKIPDSVASIGAEAFHACWSLTNITIPDSVTSIGEGAFSNCSGLTNIIIPDSVTELNDFTFAECRALIDVTIGKNVTTIWSHVFSGCSGLTDVTIPDAVTRIGNYMFSDCTGLERVKLGNALTSIGDSAFEGCSALTDVTIPDSVTSIGFAAFEGCSGLVNIKIPDSVKSIGYAAFDGCSGLTDITIPDSVTEIQGAVFSRCSNLASIIIPENVTSIGDSAFEGCSALTDVTIPESVKSIGYSAFEGCSALTDVTIPDSVTSIGYAAFKGCSGLMNIKIPDSVKSIGYSAFEGCSSLTNATISNVVTEIKSALFSGCSNLASVIIPENVTSIGDSAFEGCSRLKNVYYRASESQWDSMSIGDENLYLTDATRIYNAIWVNIKDEDGTDLCNGFVDSTKFKFSDYDKVGYTTHYYTDAELKNEYTVGETATDDIALYRMHIINQYTYKFVDYNGVVIKEETVDYGTDITAPENPSREATDKYTYTFECWEGYSEGMVQDAREMVFNAKYTEIINQYKYKFVDWDGTVLKEKIADYDEVIVTPDNPSREATDKYTYTFTLWEGYEEGMVQKAETMIFTAQYDAVINQYTYKFVDYDGTVIKEETVDYEAVITAPKAPLRAATDKYTYTFTLWEGYEEGLVQKAETMIFTAQYDAVINKYTHRFVDWDGTVIKEETIDYGSTIVLPETPVREATAQYTYIFDGWSELNEDKRQKAYEMVFTATYTAVTNSYTYKFVDNDGRVILKKTAKYGSVIAAPEKPADKDPYTFEYWDGYREGMKVEEDAAFTAVYKYKDYTVIADGKEFVVTYNTDFTLTPYEKEDYIFIGYFTQQDGQGEKVTDNRGNSIKAYDVAENLTVYAYFEHEILGDVTITGDTKAMIGTSGLRAFVNFATLNEAMGFTCDIKMPQNLEFKNVIAEDFVKIVTDDLRTENGYTYISVTGIYDYEGNYVPKNTLITPFVIEFGVAETAKVSERVVTVENVALIGSDTFTVENITGLRFEIIPKLAEAISIVDGGDNVYSATVLPCYTTDKSVTWSVSDKSVATIDQYGRLSAIKSGNVTIRATANDGSGVYAEKRVSVKVFSTIDELSISEGILSQEFNSEIYDYVLYVPTDTESISVKATYQGGILWLNGSNVWFTGQSKDINLAEEEVVFTLNLEEVPDKENSIYTFTVRKVSVAGVVSKDGTSISIKVFDIEDGMRVVLAAYKEDMLISMQSAEYKDNISFDMPQDYDIIEVIVWESWEEMAPVIPKAKVK